MQIGCPWLSSRPHESYNPERGTTTSVCAHKHSSIGVRTSGSIAPAGQKFLRLPSRTQILRLSFQDFSCRNSAMLSSFLAADGVNHLSLSHQSIIHHTGLSISNISQVFNTLTCFSHAFIKRDAWQLCKQRGYACNDFQVYCTSR